MGRKSCLPVWHIQPAQQIQSVTSGENAKGFSCRTATKMRLQSRLDISSTLQVSLSPITPHMGLFSSRKTSLRFPLILHYLELYNYFIIYHNVLLIKIKCTINIMHLSHPDTMPLLQSMENFLPQNRYLVPQRVGAPGLGQLCPIDT